MPPWIRRASAVALAVAASTLSAPAGAVVPETPIALTKPGPTESDTYADATAAVNGGGFVVTWTRRKSDGTGNSVLIQAFGATGRPMKAPAVVAKGDVTVVGVPKVLALGGDRFAVIWRRETWLYGSIYTLASNKVSAPRRLVPSSELLHDVVALPQGRIGLLTSAYDAAAASFLWTTVLDRSLRVVAGPTRLHPDGLLGFAAIGMDFTLAPLGTGALALRIDRGDGQLHARRVAPNGKPIGSFVRINATEMQIGALSDRGPKSVRAAQLTDGRVFAAWVSLEGNPYIDGFEVRGRFIGKDGRPEGRELLIGGPAGKQVLPDVLALPGGDVLVTYASEVQFVTTVRSRRISADGRLGPDVERVAGATLTFSPDTDLVRIRDGSVVDVLDGGPSRQIGAHGIPKRDF